METPTNQTPMSSLFQENPSDLDTLDLVATNKAYIAKTLDIPTNSINDVNYVSYKNYLFNEETNDVDVYTKFAKTENVDTSSWWKKNIIDKGKRIVLKGAGAFTQGINEFLKLDYMAPIVTPVATVAYWAKDGKWLDPEEAYYRAWDMYDEGSDVGKMISDYAETFYDKPTMAEGIAETIQYTPAYMWLATANVSLNLAGGVTQLGENIAESFGLDPTFEGEDVEGNEVERFSDIIYSYNSLLNSELPEHHNNLVNKYGGDESITGVTVGILDKVQYSLTNIKASLNQLQALGIKLPFSNKGVNSTKMQEMIETFKRATGIGAYSFVSSSGTKEQRLKAAGVSMVYMSTRAFSGWLDKNYQVFIADLALNTAWTAHPLWKEGNSGYEIWKRDDLTTYQKMLWTAENSTADVYFSALTKSFRNSPDYKIMSIEDKLMFETVTAQVQKDIFDMKNIEPGNINNFMINRTGAYEAIKIKKEADIAIEKEMNKLFIEQEEGL